MSKSKMITGPQKLVRRLQLAQAGLDTAKGALKEAKEQVRLAKRQRKAAKQALRRFKKEVKRVIAKLTQVRTGRTTAQAKPAQAEKPARRRRRAASRSAPRGRQVQTTAKRASRLLRKSRGVSRPPAPKAKSTEVKPAPGSGQQASLGTQTPATPSATTANEPAAASVETPVVEEIG